MLRLGLRLTRIFRGVLSRIFNIFRTADGVGFKFADGAALRIGGPASPIPAEVETYSVLGVASNFSLAEMTTTHVFGMPNGHTLNALDSFKIVEQTPSYFLEDFVFTVTTVTDNNVTTAVGAQEDFPYTTQNSVPNDANFTATIIKEE